MRIEHRQQESKRMKRTKQSIGNEVTESWARIPVGFVPIFHFPIPCACSPFSDMVRYNKTFSATSLEVN